MFVDLLAGITKDYQLRLHETGGRVKHGAKYDLNHGVDQIADYSPCGSGYLPLLREPLRDE